MAHTLLSLRHHARAVQQALLTPMLMRPHHVRSALQDNTQLRQPGLALTDLLARPTWTLMRRRLATRAVPARTRQLLQCSVQRVVLGQRTWIVLHLRHVRHAAVAHTLLSLRHHARAVQQALLTPML